MRLFLAFNSLWLVVVAVAVRSSPASAQSPRGFAEFVVEPIDGEPFSGKLVAMGDWKIGGEPISTKIASMPKTWKITLEGKPPLSGMDLVAIRRHDHEPVAAPSGSQVLLAHGDRIRAIAQSSTQESLRVNSELLGDVTIPLERVLAIVLNPPADARSREQLCRRLSVGKRRQDVLVLVNGDELAGTFTALSDLTVRLDTARGEVSVNRSEVRAIALSTELLSAPRPTALMAQVVLADGSELALLDGRMQGSSLRGRAAFGGDVSMPLEQVVALEFRNGRITYLSDLAAPDHRHTPFLNTAYEFELDRSVLGQAISLRGQVFRKGIGVHTRSELTYALAGGATRFESVVGIDDESNGQGVVVFRVLLDGKAAWESPPLTGRSPPLPVRVDLGRATKITLVADFVNQGDVLGHADWAGARLVH